MAEERWPYLLTFRDQAGRDDMKTYDGLEANFETVARYLDTLTRTRT